MGKEKEQFMRKNYFVNKSLQLKISFLIFITTCVIGVIAVWTTYITTWNEISSRFHRRQFYERINDVYKKGVSNEDKAAMINAIIIVEFSEIFDHVSSTLVLRILISSFFLFVLSIFASHKIAGPLFRMQSAANSIREGNLSVDLSKLRAGDELKELAWAINGAIAKLRQLMERYRSMANKLTDLASKIALYNQGGQEASEESARLIKELEVVSNQLVTEMNYFKTKKEQIDNKIKKEEEQGRIKHF